MFGILTRSAVVATTITGLSACAQTPAPVSAELNAQAVALAARQNTRVGENVRSDYTIGETVATGAVISQRLLVRDTLANAIRGSSRGEIRDSVERDFLQVYCLTPQYRAFIDAGGDVELVFRDRINRLLFTINLDFC